MKRLFPAVLALLTVSTVLAVATGASAQEAPTEPAAVTASCTQGPDSVLWSVPGGRAITLRQVGSDGRKSVVERRLPTDGTVDITDNPYGTYELRFKIHRTRTEIDCVHVLDNTHEFADEAHWYATNIGGTFEDALSMLIREETAGIALDDIKSGPDGDRVAGWGFERDGTDLNPWISLTANDRPARHTRRILQHNPDLELTTGAQHSYDEIVAELETVDFDALGMANVRGSYPDMKNNGIAVLLSTDHQPLAARAQDQSGSSETPAGIPLFPTYLDVGETPLVIDEGDPAARAAAAAAPVVEIKGGRVFGDCMSGVPARHNVTGQLGVVTAGHCAESDPLLFAFDSWFRIVDDDHILHSNSSDLAFYTRTGGANFDFVPEFFNGQIDKDLFKVASARVGNTVCITGRDFTSQRCGEVTAVNARPDARSGDSSSCTGTCRPVWVMIETFGNNDPFYACEGDSGGPLYKGVRVFGILSSSDYLSGVACKDLDGFDTREEAHRFTHIASYFTPAKFAQSPTRLNVDVLETRD